MKPHTAAILREALEIARAHCTYVLQLSLATKGAVAAATAHPADAAADAAETATAPAVEAHVSAETATAPAVEAHVSEHVSETGFARGARPSSARFSITMLLIAATNRSHNFWPIYAPKASSRTEVHKLPRPKATQSAWSASTQRTTRMPAGI